MIEIQAMHVQARPAVLSIKFAYAYQASITKFYVKYPNEIKQVIITLVSEGCFCFVVVFVAKPQSVSGKAVV